MEKIFNNIFNEFKNEKPLRAGFRVIQLWFIVAIVLIAVIIGVIVAGLIIG